jgi:hypothetical protein
VRLGESRHSLAWSLPQHLLLGAHGEPSSTRSIVYALTFDPYFRCAACFETPSIVPISDQLR